MVVAEKPIKDQANLKNNYYEKKKQVYEINHRTEIQSDFANFYLK